jgi:hypothetical protein
VREDYAEAKRPHRAEQDRLDDERSAPMPTAPSLLEPRKRWRLYGMTKIIGWDFQRLQSYAQAKKPEIES